MIKSEKKLKELALQLKNENDIIVAEIIETLRDEEPFEGAVRLLAECYDDNEATIVKKAIQGLMNDLKDRSVRPEVIAAIHEVREPGTLNMLVSSLWQSGLDYSGFARDVVEVFLRSDYGTAIECYTVIEESVHSMSAQQKDELRKLIGENPFPESDDKKALADDLLALLS
jgi:hypothetical protein